MNITAGVFITTRLNDFESKPSRRYFPRCHGCGGGVGDRDYNSNNNDNNDDDDDDGLLSLLHLLPLCAAVWLVY